MAFCREIANTFGSGEEEDLDELFEKAAKRIFQSGSLGVGTEIRADINFGWAFPLTLRTGVALGVLDRGVVPNKLTPEIYFAFGSSI